MLGGFGARLSAGAPTTLVRTREELRADSLGLGCDRGEDEVVEVGRVAWVVGLLSGMVMMIGVAEGWRQHKCAPSAKSESVNSVRR